MFNMVFGFVGIMVAMIIVFIAIIIDERRADDGIAHITIESFDEWAKTHDTDESIAVKAETAYAVYCGDYSMEGYSEEIVYHGTSYIEAVKAYEKAMSWMGMARIVRDDERRNG